MEGPWKIRVDTGGTFTDAWALAPDGTERRCKLLSDGAIRCRVTGVRDGWIVTDSALETPDGTFAGWTWEHPSGRRLLDSREGLRYLLPENTEGIVVGSSLELRCGDEAPVVAARLLTGAPAGAPLPPMDLRVATTRGTNALLERKGARIAFFTTKGFRDLLLIRDQRRVRLFSLDQPENSSLSAFTAEIGGRLGADGSEIEPLDEAELASSAREAIDAGCVSAAVAFLHSWRNPVHELRAAAILRGAGFRHVTLSYEAAPLIRLLPRAETAVADAFLAPVMDAFTRRVREPLAGGEPWMMTSAGGLVPAPDFRPKDSLLSGPAGGLVGAAECARRAGFDRVLTFDMGGTSTDVARIDGPFAWRHELEVGPARVFAPALKIETVAAGGGSICRWRGGRLEVGPESAGSDPGPACYGRGGPLTLTDVNLLLGLMDPDKAGIPLVRPAAEVRLEELRREIIQETGEGLSARELLEGLRDIADETMAEAIRSVSVREGCDPADYAILAFGGAGPQHACSVADRLGVTNVIVPSDAGLLSAWGLDRARRQHQSVRQILKPLESVDVDLVWMELASEAGRALGIHETEFRFQAELRLTGQEAVLTVESEAKDLETSFIRVYREHYGYPPPCGRPIELVSLRVVAEEAADAAVRETFDTGSKPGPLLLQDRFSTCVIPAGWSLRRGRSGTLLLEKSGTPSFGERAQEISGVISAGLFRSRFEGIVASMGEMLRRTALSTNVKERLDYSCALLDAKGRLVVSAPHVPVHLGALGVCVREALKSVDPGPGDVVVTNHPAWGGSHLPDVTLIAPVFDAEGSRIGFVANRAHHAEIGGRAPGSMPADAISLEEEGVAIPPRLIVRAGVPCLEEIARLLETSPWPSRRISDNLADLEAQLAACASGNAALRALAVAHGGDVIRAELESIITRSASLVRSRLEGRSFGRTVETRLDDGTPLKLRVAVKQSGMELDFSGSGPVHPRNLNATPAIVRSVSLFVLRLWLGEDVPLNEGLLEPVSIVLPEGILNPDFNRYPPPAVVGGNVETSQRLADLLLEALELAANGPGTMNNFLFGDGSFGYYETIAGGSGAGPGHRGSSGRHVHMTNTAITDPEVMEHRHPVRLMKYEIRRGSGGKGLRPGGDGMVREVEFLRPLVVSFLCERRSEGPEGMAGGGRGAAGRQIRVLPDGSEVILPGAVTYEAAAGERVRIETPGGGGWRTC